MKSNGLHASKLISLLTFPAYIVFLMMCTACVSSNSEVKIHSAPIEDPKYQPILNKWRKSVLIYKNIDLIMKASAVLVSREMEQSYKNRFIEIHGEKAKVDDKIMLSKDTISIVIDLFAKSDAYMNLSDQSMWNVNLSINNNIISPYSIERYRKKELLIPFFPLSTYWSRYYVLIFKIPFELLKGNDAKDLFEKKDNATQLPNSQDGTIVLLMNSGEAQIKFSWDI